VRPRRIEMAKISIDTKCHGSFQFTPKQDYSLPDEAGFSAIFKGCRMAIKEMGELAEHLEVIKVSLHQEKENDYLKLKAVAVFSDQCSGKEKFEAPIQFKSPYLNLSGCAETVRLGILNAVYFAISRRIHLKEKELKQLQSFGSLLTPICSGPKNTIFPLANYRDCPQCGLPNPFNFEWDRHAEQKLKCARCGSEFKL